MFISSETHSIGLFLFSLILIIPPVYAEPHDDEYAIEEIVIISNRNLLSFEQQPTRIELVGGEDINEKANMKPGDIRILLNKMTDTYVQQTSATSFNSDIRNHGLSRKYTQLLWDGVFLYRWFCYQWCYKAHVIGIIKKL